MGDIKFKNNEQFGITMEYLLCEESLLDNNLESRIYEGDLDIFKNIIKNINHRLNEIGIPLTQFNGYRNNNVDFYSNKTSISVKTNYKKSGKVCPQKIGQATKNKYKEIMKEKFNVVLDTNYDIKKFIMENTLELLEQYFLYTFCCDYTIWIYGDKNIFDFKIIDKKETAFPLSKEGKITFSNTLEKWNEGITVKYNGKSIGEFQIHNNRNCIKFRFYMNNLLNMIN